MTTSEESGLRYYRSVNEAREDCLVYELWGRGFWAEITSVAQAMIYAWHHGLQLVLDSSDFAYRARDGWTDYFQRFCRDASEVPSEKVRERLRFRPRGQPSDFPKLQAFTPPTSRFDKVELPNRDAWLRYFLRMIVELGPASATELGRLRESLDLPKDYVALHIRRGDKVGDEDSFYPTELYFERLEERVPLGNRGIFVMSDDYAAVEEVHRYLVSRGRTNQVLTLCRPVHTGFSVKDLQAGKCFAGGDREILDEAGFRRYAWAETNRLLAETLLAAQASVFVSTQGSNVGRTVRHLHPDPEACRMLIPERIPAPGRKPRATRPAKLRSWTSPRVSKVRPRLYVSLTSIFDNQRRLLRTLESVVEQSLRPDAVYVHLSDEPYLQDQGFAGRRITDEGLASFLDRHRKLVHIRWVDNTGPYRKLLPLLREIQGRRQDNDEAVRIVTLDDDLVYDPGVLASLVGSGSPCACLRGFDMGIENPSALSDWGYFRKRRLGGGNSVFHFGTGVGGVLYTMPVFEGLFEILFDEDAYRECCPTNDDIWLNLLRIANQVPITTVDAPYVAEDLTNPKTALWQRYNQRNNNRQIRATVTRLRELGVLGS